MPALTPENCGKEDATVDGEHRSGSERWGRVGTDMDGPPGLEQEPLGTSNIGSGTCPPRWMDDAMHRHRPPPLSIGNVRSPIHGDT